MHDELCYNEIMTEKNPDIIDRLVAWGCHLFHLDKHTKFFTQLAKFVIVGFANTAIDWALYFVLYYYLNLDPLIANIFSFSASTIFSYFASVLWVFDTTSKKTRRRLFTEFVILNLIALGITELLLYLFIYQLNLNDMLAKVIATAIVMIFNYVTRKLFLEEHHKPQKPETAEHQKAEKSQKQDVSDLI